MTDTTRALELADRMHGCLDDLNINLDRVRDLVVESRGPITPDEAAEVVRRAGEMAILAKAFGQDCLAVQGLMRHELYGEEL